MLYFYLILDNSYKIPVDNTIINNNLSYDSIISYKYDISKDAPFISCINRSSFYRAAEDQLYFGSPWAGKDIDGLKMFCDIFSNTYTEYALKSNKLFFYIEISSINFTYKNCSSSIIRSAFAKSIANKVIEGLLKHFSGMVDLIFADFSCERGSIGNFSELPKFRFILTFNTYFLPNNISLSFQSYPNCNFNKYYYLSKYNGLDFFFNKLFHLIEPDDNCPFVVTAVNHLSSRDQILDCWKNFFYLHGDRQNVVHTFFYSATAPMWFNEDDPTFYPFISYYYGTESNGVSPAFSEDSKTVLLYLFFFISLANSISAFAKPDPYDQNKNVLSFGLSTPTSFKCFYVPDNVCSNSYNHQLRLEYGLSFLVRRTLSLAHIYDLSFTYCGQRYYRKPNYYNSTYNDSFDSFILYLISTYFMLQGMQFSSTGSFSKANFLLADKNDLYSSFVPFEDIALTLVKDRILDDYQKDFSKFGDVVYFLKFFSELIYLHLLGSLPELKYYSNYIRFVHENEFTSFSLIDFPFKRTKLTELSLENFFYERLYVDHKLVNGDYVLQLLKYDALSNFSFFFNSFTYRDLNTYFSNFSLDYISTPDGYTLINVDDSFKHALVLPTVGFSSLD